MQIRINTAENHVKVLKGYLQQLQKLVKRSTFEKKKEKYLLVLVIPRQRLDVCLKSLPM